MGNCQAVDAATLVIQHPSGKVDKLYWPVSASEIMRTNPGYYVALLLSTTLYPPNSTSHTTTTTNTTTTTTTTTAATTTTTTTAAAVVATDGNKNGSVRLTRIKLLRPTDTLVLGHVYRLITTEEVMRGLWAKKQARMKRSESESGEKPDESVKDKQESGVHRDARKSELGKNNQKIIQVTKNERNRARTTSTNPAAASRPRTWHPSLHSISEAGTGSK